MPFAIDSDLSRNTRAYVSGFNLANVHVSRLARGQKRVLVADFNGAFPLDRTIVSVRWRCQQPYAVNMTDARIVGRETAVDIAAQYGGPSALKCEVTLDNGEVYTQVFEVTVTDAPWFQGEQVTFSGSYELTALAPVV